MTTYSIRQATVEDAPALVEFNRRLAKETEDMDLAVDTLTAGVTTILQEPSRGFYVVAIHEGDVIGQTMVTKEWSDWRNADFWWIQSVYVHRDHRRKGVFRGLYQHIKSLAAKNRVCGFRLYVERENGIAQQTYCDLGYEETVYKMFEMKM